MSAIAGIHPVREALVAGCPLERVTVARGLAGPRIQEIIDLARERGVPLRFEERRNLDRMAHGANHQGVVAVGAAARYAELADVAGRAAMVVALDGVEDPHNLGAIIRTAHAAGAGAVLIPERRAAGITETVARAAAGALAHIPLVRVGNLGRALDDLKGRGYWIYGLDERGTEDHEQVEYAAPTVLVLGGEGRGLHQNISKRCDHLVRISLAGGIASLNVSVAAGVALFEWRRRTRAAAGPDTMESSHAGA